MTERERFERLREILAEIADLEAAAAVLGWDQQTYMPPGGAAARGRQQATLRRLAHERLTSPEVGELLQALADFEQRHDAESFEASLIRVTRRQYEKAVRVPPELVRALAEASSQAFHAWVEARQRSRFELFMPHLERVLGLVVEMADRLGWEGERYDALIDLYEPGFTTADAERLFGELREGLVPLAARIAARAARDGDPLVGEYPEDRQEQLCRQVLEAMGFDFSRGRLDRSPHPFTTSFGTPGDVRLTTRYDPHHFGPALFAAMHEGGHGLYEQGLPEEFAGTPLLAAASLGFHESQSRLWENVVGRSRAFWQFFLPRVKQAFPALGHMDLDAFHRAVNRVQPSLIRVEADEVTYNLHIMLRFELERQLVRGELKVADLPEAWNAGMERYLGIRPERDSEGVLQDVHWSYGSFGYFPTYTLGNLLAAAIWEAARRDHPDLEERIAAGDLGTLLGWTRQRIHVHGAKFLPQELARRVTGEEIRAAPFLAYVRTKYGELYGL